MKKIVVALSLLSLAALMFAASPASAACSTSGARTTLASGTPVAGDVDNKQVDKYKFTVPAGQSGYLALQMFNGDIDIEVCKMSNNQTMCYSHNMAGVHDGCHVSEASVALPEPIWEEGTYLAEWGNALSPGEYRLDVSHCFSSEDGEGCDYADPLEVGAPLTGALDAAPAVQYVLLLQTQ